MDAMIALRRSGTALASSHWKIVVRAMCSSPATPKAAAAAAIKRSRSAGKTISSPSSSKSGNKSSSDPAKLGKSTLESSPSSSSTNLGTYPTPAPPKPPQTNNPVKPPPSSSSSRSQSSLPPPPSSDPSARKTPFSPAPPPQSPPRSLKDHTPSYFFPSNQHPRQLKADLYNYRYEIFKSPTRTGIFGHKVGQSRIHAPHRMARKAKNLPTIKRRSLPWEVRSLMNSRDDRKKRRKPNMKSNLLPIGGGDHAPNLALKLLQTADVSEMVRSVLLGSLLGHGNLFIDRAKYPNAAVFYFRNLPKNKQYFDWKADVFKEMAFEHSFGKRSEKLEFRTAPVPEFRHFHLITCTGNRTLVKRKWLNHITPVSLAVWWCDRGQIFGGGKKGRIITDEFEKASVEVIQKYLKVMWKVETEVVCFARHNRRWGRSRVDKVYHRLHLRTSQLKIFLRIIMGYIPVPEMIRKTVMLHDSYSQQAAWIEEMKKAMPQWIEEIDEEVATQKNARQILRCSRDNEGGDVQYRTKGWYSERRPKDGAGSRSRSIAAESGGENRQGFKSSGAVAKGDQTGSRVVAAKNDAETVPAVKSDVKTGSRVLAAKNNDRSRRSTDSQRSKQPRSESRNRTEKPKGVEISRLYDIFTNRESSSKEKIAAAA